MYIKTYWGDKACYLCYVSDDIKADDLGVWVHKGKPIRRYKVAQEKTSGTVYGVSLTNEGGENVYKLTRVYYHHKHTPSFRRPWFYASGKSSHFVLPIVCTCV